jgi:DNA-binding transcriptional ArsR family regulator
MRDAMATHGTCDPQAAADLLKAMAHPMRLAILCRLLDGEVPVSGFESELGLRQPSLSQQLGLLREAGLVSTRREAKSVYYSLEDPGLRVVIDALRSYIMGEVAAIPAPAVRQPSPGVRAAPHVPVTNSSECGVFSVAGWPAGQGRDGGRSRG